MIFTKRDVFRSSLQNAPLGIIVGAGLPLTLLNFFDISEVLVIVFLSVTIGFLLLLLGRLRSSSRQMEAALSNMAQGIAMFDTHDRLLVCNDRFREMYSLTPRQTPRGATLRSIKKAMADNGYFIGDPETFVNTARAIGTTQTVKMQNGRVMTLHKSSMEGGGWILTQQDVTEQFKAQAQIEYMAMHDALTGLPNRRKLAEHLSHVLAHDGDGPPELMIMYLDLDGFKEVNDTLGHAIGDKLLQNVATTLVASVRKEDLVARIGGDEFAIVLVGLCTTEKAESLAVRTLKTLSAPQTVDGHTVQIWASIGIARGPQDGDQVDIIQQHADLALYNAKARGKNCFSFYDRSMSDAITRKRLLESELQEAVRTSSFELYYQPIVNLTTRRPKSFEALLRWKRSDGTFVPPSEFIPIAEESALIDELGNWALREACAEATRWALPLPVAVNLSPRQIHDSSFIDDISGALESSGLDPARLQLEITEMALLQHDQHTIAALNRIKSLGVSLSLDDFGTGYSSLNYLRRFRFDKLKIDKSYIDDICIDHSSRAIVAGIIELARRAGMDVIAEGVETEEQRRVLIDLGCPKGQGYLFSPPTPAERMSALLAKATAPEAVSG